MGLAFSFVPFLDECHRCKAIQSPCLVLGSQEIHEDGNTIRKWSEQQGHKNLARTHLARDLFRERYAVDSYIDTDLNDRAEISMDLNCPLPADKAKSAMTILDAGTLEHVFDIAQAFRNIFFALRPQGTVIHIAPVTWFDHGFYNFNPKLFRDLLAVNNCRMLVEAFHFPSSALLIKRIEHAH